MNKKRKLSATSASPSADAKADARAKAKVKVNANANANPNTDTETKTKKARLFESDIDEEQFIELTSTPPFKRSLESAFHITEVKFLKCVNHFIEERISYLETQQDQQRRLDVAAGKTPPNYLFIRVRFSPSQDDLERIQELLKTKVDPHAAVIMLGSISPEERREIAAIKAQVYMVGTMAPEERRRIAALVGIPVDEDTKKDMWKIRIQPRATLSTTPVTSRASVDTKESKSTTKAYEWSAQDINVAEAVAKNQFADDRDVTHILRLLAQAKQTGGPGIFVRALVADAQKVYDVLQQVDFCCLSACHDCEFIAKDERASLSRFDVDAESG
jgi:hypothetical protein